MDIDRAKGQKHVDELVKYAKPKVSYTLVAKEVTMADNDFGKNYKAKVTAREDREPEFNKVAAAYLVSLRGIGFDSPDIAGGMVKRWFERIPDGAAKLEELYTAIEQGDQAGIKSALKHAYQLSTHNTKLETVATHAKNQPDAVRMGFYDGLANLVGTVNGYEGSAVSAAENTASVISGLQQRLAQAEAIAKTKPAGNPAPASQYKLAA